MKLSGERLRNARKYKKMTMDNLSLEMSKKFDISATKSMISQWENNKVTPRDETIEKLSLLLKVPKEYLTGSNDFGFAIMDFRMKTGMSIEEISKKTEFSIRYLNFIEQYHVLKRTADLFIFSIFIDYHDIIKLFNEKYGIVIIPSLDLMKDQLLNSEETIKEINSKIEELSREEFKEFLINKVHEIDSQINSRYKESEYFDVLEHDMDWRDKTFKNLINTTFNKSQVNQSIDLKDLYQESNVFYYNGQIITNENRKKILGMLEILLDDNK